MSHSVSDQAAPTDRSSSDLDNGTTVHAVEDHGVNDEAPEPGAGRRTVLRCAAAVGALGVTTPVLAACAADPTGSAQAAVPTGRVDLGPVADIPAAGKVFGDEKIVVTRTPEGGYRAFSAGCTHKQCVVSQIVDRLIRCQCHGSRFRAEDGSVAVGPAELPLPKIPVRVEGTRLIALPPGESASSASAASAADTS